MSRIPVRGHNVFWSMKKNTPDWVVALNQTELLQAMEDRVQVQVANMSGLWVYTCLLISVKDRC